jgi:hypothetical protein
MFNHLRAAPVWACAHSRAAKWSVIYDVFIRFRLEEENSTNIKDKFEK